MAAAEAAVRIAPGKPDGHFWLAANMAGLAESQRMRAGLHTGECELVGDDVAGIAVHIGARVMTEAEPGEVLASSTVKDLVVGSGLRFADRGLRAFKGVPDPWRLYALDRASIAFPSRPVRVSQAAGSSSSARVGSASGLENR